MNLKLCVSTTIAAGNFSRVVRMAQVIKSFMYVCDEVYDESPTGAEELLEITHRTRGDVAREYVEEYDTCMAKSSGNVVAYVPMGRASQVKARQYVNEHYVALQVSANNKNKETSYRTRERSYDDQIAAIIAICRDLFQRENYSMTDNKWTCDMDLKDRDDNGKQEAEVEEKKQEAEVEEKKQEADTIDPPPGKYEADPLGVLVNEEKTEIHEAQQKHASASKKDAYATIPGWNELSDETKALARKLYPQTVYDLLVSHIPLLKRHLTTKFMQVNREYLEGQGLDEVNLWRDLTPNTLIRRYYADTTDRTKRVKYEQQMLKSVKQIKEQKKALATSNGDIEKTAKQLADDECGLLRTVPVFARTDPVAFVLELVRSHIADSDYHYAWLSEYLPHNWAANSTQAKPIVLPVYIKADGASASKNMPRMVTTAFITLGVWHPSALQ